MLPDDTRRKIEYITSGDVIEGEEDHCIAIRNSLCKRFATGKTVKRNFESNAIVKEEQARCIAAYCDEHHFWATDVPGEDHYLTRGGEASSGCASC